MTKTKTHRNGELSELENRAVRAVIGDDLGSDFDVILGLDGGTTSTVCVCMPLLPFSDHDHLPDPLPILGHAFAGCSNHNSVGGERKKVPTEFNTLSQLIKINCTSFVLATRRGAHARIDTHCFLHKDTPMINKETSARDTLEQVMTEALSKSGSERSAVRAVCLGVSGVNHPKDQERVLNWLRDMFPSHVKLYVENDAVAALASGTMGKLHGCILIAGTGSISYGFSEDGREARAGGGGPVLGDWGSGYGIAARALTAVMRAHDGRGLQTMLTTSIVQSLDLTSPDELIGWTYADPSWARIAALVPVVVSCAEAGDQIANEILNDAVQELALSVKAVVRRLGLGGEDGYGSFPIVMVGGVLEANKSWDIGKEVIDCILKTYPGASPIKPKVEPAVGAALLAWNFLMKETEENCHR